MQAWLDQLIREHGWLQAVPAGLVYTIAIVLACKLVLPPGVERLTVATDYWSPGDA